MSDQHEPAGRERFGLMMARKTPFGKVEDRRWARGFGSLEHARFFGGLKVWLPDAVEIIEARGWPARPDFTDENRPTIWVDLGIAPDGQRESVDIGLAFVLNEWGANVERLYSTGVNAPRLSAIRGDVTEAEVFDRLTEWLGGNQLPSRSK